VGGTPRQTTKKKANRSHPWLDLIHLPDANRIRIHNPGVATQRRAAASSRMTRAVVAFWEASAPGCLLAAAVSSKTRDGPPLARPVHNVFRLPQGAVRSARQPLNQGAVF
jgi:hypothetical protein